MPNDIHLQQPAPDRLVLDMTGSWRIDDPKPALDVVESRLAEGPEIRAVSFGSTTLGEWDSSLLTYLRQVMRLCAARQVAVDLAGLPEGARRLLTLAAAVPPQDDARAAGARDPFLASVGADVIEFCKSCGELIGFVGATFVAGARLVAGRARFRPQDLRGFLLDCGARALPIVSLISLLVGLILAFIGILQLKYFGAQVFVADLVGIGMVRQMGAIMTGVIMAGRTGAAFAAQLGTMQVNEEIDALQTLGINPMEFLVLPRMLALTAMMPLLCLYANLMGVLGGFAVAVGLYGVNSTTYVQRTLEAVGVQDLWVGLFMSFVFGILVSLAGCLRGLQCGRSASAVGDAATSAVVTGIVAIVVATASITVLCDVLGI
ncbi:MAG: ABC transporter permease [Desulfobacterales bacterium]|jgi:phospholipid/cholesterol/gamma-HCH transport system permease protein